MSAIKKQLQLTRIPEYMHDGIVYYIYSGILPGSFLTAVLQNDLKMAAGCADNTNRHLLYDYIEFFVNYAPSNCWGSHENVAFWVHSKQEQRDKPI